MNFQEYSAYFESILNKNSNEHLSPYDNPDYLDYTKLNWVRMNRWFKTGKLADELLLAVKKINKPQQWMVITEPWCGDASHNIPFIEMIAKENPLISISYELRDAAPFSIEQYLTNGTKSIPKLVIRNAKGDDLGIWGPRPKDCQKMYSSLIADKASFEKVKVEIQNWYNANKGADLQGELLELISSIAASKP